MTCFRATSTSREQKLANAARTQAYVENIVPLFGFDSCWDSESLPCVLGDAPYRSPVLDPAPWFSDARPASAKFLGFYPLNITGVEDSSREVNVTELVQDGAVFSMPRKASKEFRVQGLLMAEDSEGLDVGMSWLRGALEGAECGGGEDCTGDTFCYLAYLPPCCDYNDTTQWPLVPVDWTQEANSVGPWVPYGFTQASDVTSGAAGTGVRVNMACPEAGVQLFMDGLIPGATYRASVEVASNGRLHLSIGGNPGIAARRANEHFPDDRNTWVGDFVATGETQTLRVLSDAAECGAQVTRIYSAKVERTAELLTKFLPRFTSESFTEPASWSPVGTTIQRSAAIAGPNSIEMLSLLWTNTTASTVTIPANSGGRRLIRGLTAGQDYIVYVKARATTGVAIHFNIGPTLPEKTTSLGANWYAIAFTAAQPQQYLDILTSATAPLTAGNSASIDIEYLRVDADAQSLYIAPVDQAEPALRSLHNVTLLDGPNVVDEFAKVNGAMRSVEFTMVVGEPAIYGQLVDVRPTIEATTFLVGNTRCMQGYPVRYNLFTNPRLGGAAVGSTPVIGIGQHVVTTVANATATVAAADDQTSDPLPAPITYVPHQSIKVHPTGTNASFVAVDVDEIGDLKVGHTYTVSATFSQTAHQTGTLSPFARTINVPTGGGDVYSIPAANTPGAQRVSMTFTYLGKTAKIRFYNGAPSGGGDVYWSNFLFEEGGIAGSPFDGDTDGAGTEYRWVISATNPAAGTQHASPSQFMEDKPKLIVDPTCPPVPVAPQPPGIPPDCPRDVTEWRRYWTAIPSELSGGWRESVPVIKLSTSAHEVREVRVRFYPNPLGTDLSEVDECGSCGEFFISYIPKSTVMKIDAIRRRITANVAGTGDANAMHLASDTDYGPVRWPTMTCDVGYYMTVDIAPDEVLDLDVRLAVAQRE